MILNLAVVALAFRKTLEPQRPECGGGSSVRPGGSTRLCFAHDARRRIPPKSKAEI